VLFRSVDHRSDVAGNQRLGSHPIKVDMVDDRDVARMEASAEVLRPAIEARMTDQPGRLIARAGTPKSCEPHL